MHESTHLDQETLNKYNVYGERILSVNEFSQPKVLKGADAVIYKLLELWLMRPGTYPTRPYMGLGLVENYRYTYFDQLDTLKNNMEEQMNTYLPEFADVSIKIDTIAQKDKVLIIYLYITNQLYSVTLDTDKKTIAWLKGFNK